QVLKSNRCVRVIHIYALQIGSKLDKVTEIALVLGIAEDIVLTQDKLHSLAWIHNPSENDMITVAITLIIT
ncbi:hypothetical protein COM11_23895, partial [Bacillus pseudomycoides]